MYIYITIECIYIQDKSAVGQLRLPEVSLLRSRVHTHTHTHIYTHMHYYVTSDLIAATHLHTHAAHITCSRRHTHTVM